MKRAINIEGLGKELILSKVTEVKVPRKFIEIEELNDGTYRLIYSKSLIDDISKVTSLTIIRED